MTSSANALPSVAVIIPAYKQAHFIARCLDSVAAQTYQGDIQAIVIDDGSPDQSAQYARAHAIGALVIRQENAGVSSARNAGIAAAKSDFLAFLDADDAWHPSKLERQFDAIRAAHGDPHTPTLCFTRYQRVDPEGVVATTSPDHPSTTLRPSPKRLLYENFVGTSTVLAHRDCFERCGGFPSGNNLLKAGQDYALWLRIALHYPLVYVPHILMDYTVHPTNRVGTNPLKHYTGGINALKALWQWDAQLARRVAERPLELVALYRSFKLLRDLIARRAEHSRQTLLDAPSTVLKTMLTLRS